MVKNTTATKAFLLVQEKAMSFPNLTIRYLHVHSTQQSYVRAIRLN